MNQGTCSPCPRAKSLDQRHHLLNASSAILRKPNGDSKLDTPSLASMMFSWPRQAEVMLEQHHMLHSMAMGYLMM